MKNKLLLATCAVMTLAPAAMSCDCHPKRSVQDELSTVSAVFSGKVKEIHWYDKEVQNFHGKRFQKPIIIVTVEVAKTWKGEAGSQVEVETADPEENNCGFDFKKGEDYLIYAVKKQRLETDVCSRTKLLSAASEDLASLDAAR